MRRLTRRQRVSAVLLSAVAVLFVTLDLGGGALGGARGGVSGVLGSLYRGTDGVLGPARRWVEGVPDAGINEARIRQLQQQNERLHAELAARQADVRTIGQLARLQRATDGRDLHPLPAHVVALGPGQGFDWTVTLDRGSDDGVRDGQTVIAGGALVGRVVSTSSTSARVLLAADPGSGVGARDLRTGEIGVVAGRGAAGFVFTPLRPAATVHVGDDVMTGPSRESSYVAGLSVGRVSAVHAAQDGTVTGTVVPTASPTGLDLVGVLIDPGVGTSIAAGHR